MAGEANGQFPRREFLAGSAAVLAAAGLSPAVRGAAGEESADAFSFALLGDTHFDRLAHHDMAWLTAEHPDGVAQVRRYSEHAATLLPELFATIGRRIAAARTTFDAVVHVGDFLEGLCGTAALAERQAAEGVEFWTAARWQVPLLLTKGNHDVTGPGAAEAYKRTLLPALEKPLGVKLPEARYAVQRRGALFAMFDAYDKTSLDWLRETLGRTRRRGPTFVVVHQPVVPFQARGNWSLFMRDEQTKQRSELLNLLGEHRAIVLCGHVHRYGFVVRNTQRGPFAQLAVSSILSARDQRPKQLLEGLDSYGPELTELEPNFQPDSKELRRLRLAAEKPHLAHYEYADTAGYAVVNVAGNRVTAEIHNGTSDSAWRTVELTRLLE